MAKNDQEEVYGKVLVESFSRVNEWVKFAEAKNAALLAFSSAWAVAIGNLLIKDGGVPAQYATYLPVAGCLFLASALIAVLSFIPRISLGRFFKGERAVSRPLNLLFFGDIASLEIADVENRLKARYLPTQNRSMSDDYAEDIACQIHVNSAIANRKFKQFRISAYFVLAAMLILSLPAIRYICALAIRAAMELAR